MNILSIYKRMQTPGTREKLKQKFLDKILHPKTPKRLKFGDLYAPISNASPTTVSERLSPAAAAPRAPGNFLKQEVDRLNEERDVLSNMLVLKKRELNDLKQIRIYHLPLAFRETPSPSLRVTIATEKVIDRS